MKKQPEAEPEEEKEIIGKDELNLVEFPIAVLSEKAPPGVKSLVFKDQIFDSGKKKLLNRKLTIEGSDTYGLPTAKDDEVILALIQLSKRKRFHDKRLEFTRFELINMLGWANTGQSYARILLALRRWVSVTLHYENAWWDKQEERWTSGAFHIIDDFELNDSRESNAQLTLLTSRIIWSARVFDSFVEGNLKNIRYDLYQKLGSAISKRMFRFLDKRFYNNKNVTFDLRDFAWEHIGLSRSYRDAGKLKEKLEIGIRELEEIGFIEPVSREARYQHEGRGKWRICFARKVDTPAPLPNAAETAPTPALVEALLSRGVSERTALELVADFSEEAITSKIDVFDWLSEKNDRGIAASPSGYLVKSIQDGYAVPKGFVSKAERQKKSAMKQTAAQQAAEATRLKKEQRQAELDARKADRDSIDSYIKQRSPEELKALEREALEQADADARHSWENALNASFRKMVLNSILDEHIRRLLAKQAEPA